MKKMEGEELQVKISKTSAFRRQDPQVLKIHKVFPVTSMMLNGHKPPQSSLHIKT